VHQNLEDEPLEIEENIEGNIAQDLIDTTTDIPTPTTATVNHNLDISQHTFSMPHNNVTYIVARSTLVGNRKHILTLVGHLDVSSIRADPIVLLDRTLHKDLDFMKT